MTLEREYFLWIHEEELPHLFESCCEKAVNEDLDIGERFSSCPPEKFAQLERDILVVIKKLALNVLSKDKFEEFFSWMKPATYEAIIKLIDNKKQVIRKSVLLEEMKLVHHLTDFDYNVKLCVSSSKMMDLNQCLLSLFLYTRAPTGETKTLHMEMTSEELQDLISVLKEAKSKIEVIPNS